MKGLLFIGLMFAFSAVCFSQEAGLQFDANLFPSSKIHPLSLEALSSTPPKRDLTFHQTGNQLPDGIPVASMAFFCRLEVKMEKAANFPVKFRLGTVDYVDRLEQKTFYSSEAARSH